MTGFIRIPKYEWTKDRGDYVDGDALIAIAWIMFVRPTGVGSEVVTGQRIFQTPLTLDEVSALVEAAAAVRG